MRKTIRLAVAAASAALLVPLAATASVAQQRSGYCPRYDAYELNNCSVRHAVPGGPLGQQLRWVLAQLAGGAATLTVDEVRSHLSPGMQEIQPAEDVVTAFQQTFAEQGPLRFVGFSYPPRSDQAAAIVQAGNGTRAAVALGIAGSLIDTLGLDEAPPTIVPRGRYSGWFDV